MRTLINVGSVSWCVLLLGAPALSWRWPEEPVAASSVHVDTKVRFTDDSQHRDPRDKSVFVTTTTIKHTNHANPAYHDDASFRLPIDTEGFYNRPPGAGRYPVRVQAYQTPYTVDQSGVYPVITKGQTHRPQQYESDGTLDSFQYCKCTPTAECNPRPDSERACGAGKYLCCHKKPHKGTPPNSEVFNEIDDERPMLFPGQENKGGAFPPPDSVPFEEVPTHGIPRDDQPDVLIGPEGPTGQVGPPNKYILVGPGGPTHNIGPVTRPVLVGPNGPNGVIGPDAVNLNGDMGHSASAQRGVLVGPGGPTGIIGPYNSYAQRGVLTAPGGPTGIIGPGRGGRRGVLTGPGGPTGVIGPGYRQQGQRGLLVGPGGPTGTIGPGRQLLVGPGGPTGQIGPQRYFGNYNY